MKTNNPSFSVIIPVYNTASFFPTMIESVLNQTYKKFEIIVIDDGSTDDSKKIEESYAKKNKCISLLLNKNSGVAAARNRGIEHAKNDYLIFLDSDDWLDANALELLAQTVKNNKNPDVVVYGGRCFPNSNGKHWVEEILNTRNAFYKEFNQDVMFKEKGTKPFLWQNLLKRTFVKRNNLKINEHLKIGEDQEFQFRLFPLAKKIVFIESKIYNYRVSRENSLMDSFDKFYLRKLSEHFKQVKLIIESWKKYKILNRYSLDLFTWIILFLGYDILKITDRKTQKDFCQQFINLLKFAPSETVYLLSYEPTNVLLSVKAALQNSENINYKNEIMLLTAKIERLTNDYNGIIKSRRYRLGKFLSLNKSK